MNVGLLRLVTNRFQHLSPPKSDFATPNPGDKKFNSRLVVPTSKALSQPDLRQGFLCWQKPEKSQRYSAKGLLPGGKPDPARNSQASFRRPLALADPSNAEHAKTLLHRSGWRVEEGAFPSPGVCEAK